MNFDFTEWISTHEKPEILEYLLYHSRHYGRGDLIEGDFPFDEIIDSCIFNRYFLNIRPILKYINVPRFSEDDCRLYFLKISSMRPNLTEEKLHKAEKRMKRERIHQMLQIIWMHIDCRHHHCTEAASEALRLIWCSVPDAYISFKEINRVFRGIFRAEELKNIYGFYAKAVGLGFDTDGHRFETRFHRRSAVDVNLVDVESDFRCETSSWCGILKSGCSNRCRPRHLS
ncbi:hypothetical protein AVEN_51809-1 [Araneus ventricosus]|uniref:SOCS box domain-containing protein n=1 Tax=Araneus ventricosus TaxID=182803 RepID=A0A4Y2TY24_ARAVE|nr:hypothetical protein AVEN_51809-1 [Araneus ventricosus]